MVVSGCSNVLTASGFLANCQFDSQLAKRDLRVVIEYMEELEGNSEA